MWQDNSLLFPYFQCFSVGDHYLVNIFLKITFFYYMKWFRVCNKNVSKIMMLIIKNWIALGLHSHPEKKYVHKKSKLVPANELSHVLWWCKAGNFIFWCCERCIIAVVYHRLQFNCVNKVLTFFAKICLNIAALFFYTVFEQFSILYEKKNNLFRLIYVKLWQKCRCG